MLTIRLCGESRLRLLNAHLWEKHWELSEAYDLSLSFYLAVYLVLSSRNLSTVFLTSMQPSSWKHL